MIDIITAAFVGGVAGVENLAELLPFAKRSGGTPPPTPSEFAEASAAMLADWGIDDPALDKSVALQARMTGQDHLRGSRRHG